MFSQRSSENNQLFLFLKAVLIAAVCLLIFGVYQLVDTQNAKQEPILVEKIELTQEKIVVEISGAVKKPGVYRLEEGSRVIDLVKRSGGITDQADLIKLAGDLNMAQLLKDEDRIFISFDGQKNINDNMNDQSNGEISINSASQSQLEELDGIGEKRALEIILQRPYQSVEDLLEKEVLSKTLFEKIKGDIKL